MIIGPPLKRKFASVTANSKIDNLETLSIEIKGRVRIKDAIAYLYLPKISELGIDTHKGVQFSETNLDVSIETPRKMSELGLLK